MKKLLTTFALLFIFFLSSTNITYAKTNDEIKINTTKKTIFINSTYQLKISGTTNKIIWKTSDSNIATVNSKGKVSAKTKGKCVITAQVRSGNELLKFKCTIYVKGRLSSASGNSVNGKIDEFIEVRLLFNKPKDEEYLVVDSDGYKVICEWGDWDGDYISLFLYPQKKGIHTISIYIAKDNTTSTGSAELDAINRLTNPYTTYEQLDIIVNVGICSKYPWISTSSLYKNYDVSVSCTDEIYISYNQPDSISGIVGSLIIEPTHKNIGVEYKDQGLRYRYVSADEVEFNIEDLKNLGIIE